jgi:putative ABC transport system permease protein
MGDLFRDVRYSFRMFLQNPGFAAAAILSLALGIGANTTIFSAVNVLMFRPLAFKEPHRLVLLDERNPKEHRRREPKLSTLVELQRREASFEQVEGATMYLEPGTITGGTEAERIRSQFISPGLFSLLGVEPALGRGFVDEDAAYDASSAIVVSHGLWQRRFGGSAAILGKTVTLEGQVRTIIGVMPPGFWVYPWTRDVDVWIALNLTNNRLTPGTRWLSVLARLKPGAKVEQARAEMDVFARHFEEQDPKENRGWRLNVEDLREYYFGGWGEDVYLLLGAVGFILLIACANVANLLLARAATREREMALRTSLGAGRFRIFRQLLTESILLALLGGALGLLVAVWGKRVFLALAEWFPRGGEIRIDTAVLGFTLGISLLTGIVFGLIPSLKASKVSLNESLKAAGSRSGGQSRQVGRSLIVIVEIALALVLLIGAGLMINSLFRLKGVDLGYNPRNLLVGSIQLTDVRYRELLADDRKRVTPQVDSFYQQVMDRLQTVPGVISAGVASPTMGPVQFKILGQPAQPSGQELQAALFETNPGYFRAMQIPLLKGRSLTGQDDARAQWVVVVSESLARRYFPGEDPIGKMLQVEFRQAGLSILEDQPRQIVGIVGDVRHWGLYNDPPPTLYVPDLQHIWVSPSGVSMRHLFRTLFIRTSSNPMKLASSLRQVVAQVDRDQAVFDIMPMEERLSTWVAYQRFYMELFGIFAGLAVILAVIGIYGVMSYSVARRTHEIGVRVAIGASRGRVLFLVLRRALWLTLAGVAMGIGAAIGLTRLIANRLYGVKPVDPLTFTIVSLVLIGVGLLASFIPARRAAKVNPVEALRCE